MKKEEFKVLYRSDLQNYSNSMLYHEVIEFNGERRFAITIDIHNGSTKVNTTLKILLPDGTWAHVANACLLNIELHSYVRSDDINTCKDTVKRVQTAFKKYIKSVYS